MAVIGTFRTSVEIPCPRCGDTIACDVQIGPGCSVGTAADGRAEMTVQVASEPREHVCSGGVHADR